MPYEFDKSTVCSDKGFCYIIEFGNGVIKPGKTKNLLKRFNQHKTDAKKHGIEVMRVAFTDQHSSYGNTERAMLSILYSKSSENTGEYMKVLLFEDCVKSMAEIGHVLNISSEIIDPSKRQVSPKKLIFDVTEKERSSQQEGAVELTGEITLEEFTKLTGYSAITVAQAVLYRQDRKPAIMARKMGLVYERSDLVRLAAPRKPRADKSEHPGYSIFDFMRGVPEFFRSAA